MSEPVIWALTGDKTGDNNQLLALAEMIGLPFAVKRLSYNLARAVPPRFLGTSLLSLTAEARRQLAPPWPDLVIAIGRRSVATARWLKKNHGAGLVLMGHPRVDPAEFDLVITTRQYPVPRHDNVLLLPMPLSRLGERPEPNAAETALLGRLPRPHLLLAIGGPTKYWELDADAMAAAVAALDARARRLGGSLLAIGSRRTPGEVIAAVRGPLGERLVTDPAIRFASLMHDADEIFVTADSISMLSEAIQTGKPVGMVPIQLSDTGRRRLGAEPGAVRHRHRDLRHIWDYLLREGLVGTVEEPRSGDWDGAAVRHAAEAVRQLLDGGDDHAG
ncbi:ELM1/GtrOC1 family putative glycosyltransferase [Sphingomonas mesophila]|uniref:ELM1/GtrOC1 family putative glycosyltransferase n=1 Tax=Sphingomonas mesophila TaxID=2303576 RepID=UPI000E5799A9|nr:ELM1/GtrOC1 family putative glycosyltransferase [Sphingomonas mesophila]